jgi:autoinducer 2-degrading protein
MYIAHVFVHVKPDQIEAFKAASLENARASLKEPGIARFDVIQQSDDLTRFVLLEVYRTQADTNAHKESAHYQRWRDAVEPLQAEPRSKIVYQNIFPAEQGWDSSDAL